jgi:hypothetical protein
MQTTELIDATVAALTFIYVAFVAVLSLGILSRIYTYLSLMVEEKELERRRLL